MNLPTPEPITTNVSAWSSITNTTVLPASNVVVTVAVGYQDDGGRQDTPPQVAVNNT